MDAAFCFCCRKFGTVFPLAGSENTFVRRGYRNWKTALEKEKGFPLHERSAAHISAMSAWSELKKRKLTQKEVSTLINETVLEKHRYYVSSIIDMIKFLARNEQPFRGDTENEDITSDKTEGLFRQLFAYTVKKDAQLAEICKCIPVTAQYTSPEIQNELIAILAELTAAAVAEKVKQADLPMFVIKVDGTKDKVGRESISIVLRSVLHGIPFEHLLTIATTEDLHADAISALIIDKLKCFGIEPKNILAQCYDGASVMSGNHGGVQKILQDLLGKQIPYIHCYNHVLHLVVQYAISEHPKVSRYFEICSVLRHFTKRHSVAILYEGQQLQRLLPQRWSGHFLTTSAIVRNYDEIVSLLNRCSSPLVPADVSLEATGLLSAVDTEEFRFLSRMLESLLGILNPLNNALQSKSMDLLTASSLVSTTMHEVEKQAEAERFDQLYNSIFLDEGLAAPQIKRMCRIPDKFHDSVLTQSLPQIRRDSGYSQRQEMRQLYGAIFDRTVAEIKLRFSARNTALIHSMHSLISLHRDGEDFLNTTHLSALAKLCDVNMDIASSEIITARRFLLQKYKEGVFTADLQELTRFLFTYRDAFPSVYKLYASSLTIGASTSSCERTFSTLTRIFSSYRRSMLHSRMANLILLSQESDIMDSIALEQVMRVFNDSKSRRLQLY